MTGYPRSVALGRPPARAAQEANRQLWSAAVPAPVADSSAQRARRININSEDLKNGLARLVLALVKLLHELLEKQAIRRIEAGRLSEADCERIGFTLMKQSEQLEKLRQAFGLSEEDLNLDLGPLGKLL
jgi:hypothetical protein